MATTAELGTAPLPPADDTPPVETPAVLPGAHLEAEDDVADDDSSYDAATLHSETTSLASSIAKFRHENGRRYHAYKDGAYILPNDEVEQERLDLQHNLLDMTFRGKLYTCPAGQDKPLRRVLDIGTGTGIWAMDFADEHPETEVVGVDLSPIQPAFVPPNVQFFVDDVESEWAYVSKFDLIYTRMMTGSLGNWPQFIKEAYENLNPGGWVEFVDIGYISCDDGSLPADSALQKWTRYIDDAAVKINRPMNAAKSHAKNLQDAGYIHVQETHYKWPTNQWPKDPHFKELGRWTTENMGGGLQAISMALLTRVLGWSTEEVEVFIAKVRADIRNQSYHAYWPIIVIYAQKPDYVPPESPSGSERSS